VADNRTVSADLLRDGQEQRGYFPCEVLHAVGDLGLMGMLVNGAYGGSNARAVAYGAAIEEIGTADGSVASAWNAPRPSERCY
jgi:alkylation response protein AidB-like acyl-CoA dehydrogenase